MDAFQSTDILLELLDAGRKKRIFVYAWKEYRKRNASGAVYDDPRVAVGVGRFDEVVALAEA